jgi:hypothetical protein
VRAGAIVADEPTPAEVTRRLDDFKDDVREDLRELRARFDRTVASDVYTADNRARDEREGALAARVKELEDQRDAAERRSEDSKRRLAESRRWLIAAVLLPLGTAIAEIVITLRGGK